MRSTQRLTSRPMPMLPALAAGLALLLGACTGDAAGSATPSPAESAAESVAASSAESMAPSVEESVAPSEAEPAGQTVTLSNFAFGTDEITIAAGETITFVNEDAAPHTVTEGQNGNATDGARFDEQLAGGESAEITFDEPGDYDVTCLFHSNMNMVVHVQ